MKRIIIIAAIITSCLSACRKGDENITGVPLSKDNLASGIIHSRSVVGNVITEKISGWVRDTSGIGIDHAIVIVSRISDSVYIDIGSLRNAVTGNFSVGWGPVILSVDVNGDGKMYHIYTSNMPQ
jgi:hypothetical protein